MADTRKFKDILKDLRLETGLKQKDVAKACDVSAQCVSQLELGVRNPTGTTLAALADFFNCSIDYLMGRSEEYETVSSSPPVKKGETKEEELLSVYRTLPEDYQKHIVNYTKKLAELYGEEKR